MVLSVLQGNLSPYCVFILRTSSTTAKVSCTLNSFVVLKHVPEDLLLDCEMPSAQVNCSIFAEHISQC